MGSSHDSRANNIYSSGCDKLTEMQLYMSISCQPGSPEIRAFSDAEKHFFYFLIWRLKPPNQKKGFSMSKKARISSQVSKFYSPAGGGIATSVEKIDIHLTREEHSPGHK